jgi:hypothetical protein
VVCTDDSCLPARRSRRSAALRRAAAAAAPRCRLRRAAAAAFADLRAPSEGGRTIFPLCRPPPAASGDPSTPAAQLHAEFREALRGMWGEREQQYARQAAIDPQVAADHPFMGLMEQACRGEYGVAITPSPGTALRFEHILPDGSYNTATWHDGCNVISGTKIILQKFKELPQARRRPGDSGVYTVDSGKFNGQKLGQARYNPWDPEGGY